MSGLNSLKCIKKVCGYLAIFLVVYAPLMSQAQAADVVTTYKDENGWKLQVNGNDFYIKGVVWGYTPRDQNFNYNLWGEPEEFIKKVLDYEFGLMRAAGVNAVRSFSTMPPKWVTYVYQEYGIMTVINDLMGRYGYSVGGKWIPRTDYSDELTRATLKKDMLEVVEKYKNVPGVLMFAFGMKVIMASNGPVQKSKISLKANGIKKKQNICIPCSMKSWGQASVSTKIILLRLLMAKYSIST